MLKLEVKQNTEVEQLKQAFCKVIATEVERNPAILTRSVIERMMLVVPHMIETASFLAPWLSDEELVYPYYGISQFYIWQALYVQASPWLEQCIEIAQERLGESHPDLAFSLRNLAELHRLQGRYLEAEPLLTRAALIVENLDETHPYVNLISGSLAVLYQTQGRYSKAGSVSVHLLRILEQQAEKDYPNIAQGLSNLAMIR